MRQNVGIGAAPNDGTGDTLRVAGDKINDNFIEAYAGKLVAASVDTSGGTLTLNFSADLCGFGVFSGSASFAAAKAVALSNDTNALKFELGVQITNVAATLDFGSGSVFKSNSSDFTPGTQVFTPSDTGFILITGTKVGSNWWLEFKYGFA